MHIYLLKLLNNYLQDQKAKKNVCIFTSVLITFNYLNFAMSNTQINEKKKKNMIGQTIKLYCIKMYV